MAVSVAAPAPGATPPEGATAGVLLRLTGDLASARLTPWIERRAALLSLSGWVRRESPRAVTIAVTGPPALIDAMEAACSLGPFDVIVDHIAREETAFAAPPSGFEIAA